ncbi:cobalt-precorrin-6A reductase [Rhodobacter sp. SGA-6-6]|uniref:cobalt-precorrin-6A reductase n=1 Tax=Rhodobacter sp. SGA-6-6 TaxID=2710882 RepID=UPI0013EB8425|nr:cobalt-precorrin-6A reductase [Rhodobacter sp. SGA-6-6]NGM45929.1 cobalt-precorrin-6A reductase [Rhodobacter sp. SGA-6-6]
MTTLILGGTTEASRLAELLAAAGLPAVLSYAGRTESPRAQPVPTRIGGFGGAEGLARYLKAEGIGRVIDATHPFAAQMSRNAVAACAATGTPLLALERPAWQPGPGDRWTMVPDLQAAAALLDGPRQRVFLAIGRQHLSAFAGQPQHHYLLRLVDPPGALPLPDCTLELARGPFDAAQDRALMLRHGITLIVAKNAGGAGAEAKLTAARDLSLPVILIDRPALPPRPVAATVEEALRWCHADLGV